MRRATLLLAFTTLSMPSAWASGHGHVIATHARALTSNPMHTHAPSIFPRVVQTSVGENNNSDVATSRQNSFAAFVARTMLGLSSHFSH